MIAYCDNTTGNNPAQYKIGVVANLHNYWLQGVQVLGMKIHLSVVSNIN